jgi:hypothetical protein
MKGNVLVMTIRECVWRSTIDIIWPFLSLYVLSLGGSYATIGIIMASGHAASARICWCFSYSSFTNTWQWLGVGMFAQNIVTFYFLALQALIADSLPPGKRGIGFAAKVAIPSAFSLVAPVVGSWLIDSFGIYRAMHGLYFASFWKCFFHIYY